MNATSTELDRLIAKEDARRKAAIERVVARGGLPTLEDFDTLSGIMQRFFDSLEGFVWTVEAVGNCENYDEPVPVPVTVENIAAIGLIVDEVNERLDDCRKLSDRLAQMLSPIDVVRRLQAEAT